MPSQKNFRLCVVCGIKSGRENNKKRLLMARFPSDEDRCKQWVKMIGIKELVYIPIAKLQSNVYVCANHFRQKDFNKKTSRLKKKAVPSIGLVAKPLSDDLLHDFPCQVLKEQHKPYKGIIRKILLSTVRTVIKSKDEQRGKHCVKCDASPADHPDTILFKFPKPGFVNDQQAELWAKYAYPNQPWSNKDFQMKLFYEEKMLCHRHFKKTWFVNRKSSKLLRRLAFPDVDEETEVIPEEDDVRSLGSPSPQPLSDIITDITSDVPEPSGLDIVIPLTSTTEADSKQTLFNIERNYMDIEVPYYSGTSKTSLKVPIVSNCVVPETSNTSLKVPIVSNCVVPETSNTSLKVPIVSNCVVPKTSNTSLKVPIVSNCVVPETSNTKVLVIDASLMPLNASKTRLNVPTAFVKNCKVPGNYINRNNVPITSNCKVPGTYVNRNNVPITSNCKVSGTYVNRNNVPITSNCKVPGTYVNRNNVPITSNCKVPGTSEIRFNAPEASNCEKHIKIIRNLKRRLKCLENKAYFAKLTTDEAIKKLVTNMSAELRQESLKRQRKKKVNIKTEIWSQDDKIRALRLYKKSPSYYRLMRQMFDLPSPDVVLDFILKTRSRIKTNKNDIHTAPSSPKLSN